jgi:hypothetical protein
MCMLAEIHMLRAEAQARVAAQEAGNFELETGSIWSASTATPISANRRFP